CYNFGSAGYFSSQERILFEELLAAGRKPNLAVFVDGLNEFAIAVPWPSVLLRRYMDAPEAAATALLVRRLPPVALIERFKAGRRRRRSDRELAAEYDDPELLEGRIDRYLANRRLTKSVADACHVPTLFVWQPVPTYHYELRYHLFRDFDFQQNTYSA